MMSTTADTITPRMSKFQFHPEIAMLHSVGVFPDSRVTVFKSRDLMVIGLDPCTPTEKQDPRECDVYKFVGPSLTEIQVGNHTLLLGKSKTHPFLHARDSSGNPLVMPATILQGTNQEDLHGILVRRAFYEPQSGLTLACLALTYMRQQDLALDCLKEDEEEGYLSQQDTPLAME
jgi:hypothetical protein